MKTLIKTLVLVSFILIGCLKTDNEYNDIGQYFIPYKISPGDNKTSPDYIIERKYDTLSKKISFGLQFLLAENNDAIDYFGDFGSWSDKDNNYEVSFVWTIDSSKMYLGYNILINKSRTITEYFTEIKPSDLYATRFYTFDIINYHNKIEFLTSVYQVRYDGIAIPDSLMLKTEIDVNIPDLRICNPPRVKDKVILKDTLYMKIEYARY